MRTPTGQCQAAPLPAMPHWLRSGSQCVRKRRGVLQRGRRRVAHFHMPSTLMFSPCESRPHSTHFAI
eukprot:COSAG01_NODE_2085_length_8459_cov_14.269139_3_plen_67_part_00